MSLNRDEVFEILKSQRRRMVLYYLRRNGDPVTMPELVEQIAAWENDVEIDEISSQQRKRTYVSLYQTHLPKLADTGLIEYEGDDEDITLTDRAMEIDAFLTPKQTTTYPWRRYYLVLVVLIGALLSVGVFSTQILDSSVLLWISLGIVLGYVMTLAVEYWDHRKERAEIPAELVPQSQ